MYISLSKRTFIEFDNFGRPIPSVDIANVPIDVNGNPILSSTGTNNTPLALYLSGFTLLFCIYLYFYISPLLKDKNCIAPRSNRPDILLSEDPERPHTTQSKSTATKETRASPNHEGTPIPVLEKKVPHKWMQRIGFSRFFITNGSDKPKSKMASKEDQFYQSPSSSDTSSLVSPPPPAYVNPTAHRSPLSGPPLSNSGSVEIQSITISCLPIAKESTPYHLHQRTNSGSILTEKSDRYPDFKRMSSTRKSQSEMITIDCGIQPPSRTVVVDPSRGISGGSIGGVVPCVS